MSKYLSKTVVQLLLALGAIAVIFVFSYASAHLRTDVLGTTAQKIVADCSKISGDRSACYETEVPSLYPKLSVPQIFTVIRSIRTLDPTYQFCHVLAHKVGGRVVAEDPSKWIDAIPLNPPDGLCSNGFIHGIIVGRFSSEVLASSTIEAYMPDFAKACEPRPDWQPSSLDQAICYHGMGHLFDFITNADLPQGLSLCNRIGVTPQGDFRQVCYEGIFMQIYQPLEPDDYALIAQMKSPPTKDTVRSFCGAYTDPKYEGACLRESWPFFQKSILNGTGAEGFCANQPDAAETNNCYNSISSIVGRMSLGSTTQAMHACNNFPAQWQATCYSFSAEAVLEEDRDDASAAIALCAQGQGAIGQACIQQLVDHSKFLFGNNKEEYDGFCKDVPQAYMQQCINNESHL